MIKPMNNNKLPKNNHGVTIHGEKEFVAMQKAGKLAASILDDLYDFIDVGVTTNQINDFCHNKIIEAGAIPAPLGYRGFPKSVCTSVNHIVCHGIPSNKMLKNGDIINVDVTVIVDGWHGDTSRMYFVGNKVPIKAKLLVKNTYEAMMAGINQVKPGATLGDIGYAIEAKAKENNYGVVKDYCGHGLGLVFHDAPNVLHYGKKGDGMVLEEGMFFTIEPMLNLGKADTILNKNDGWTVTTRDKSLSAQFEHSVGVTKNGCEIFTKSLKGLDMPK